MRVFLTGATGYIGSAVLAALLQAGHQVTALVRSSEKKEQVARSGGLGVIGNLADVASYRVAARGHDGYIHAAFESSDRWRDLDRSAIETFTALAAEEPARFVLYTSGVWVLGNTDGPSAEEAPLNPAVLAAWRPAHEQLVLAAAARGVRPIVVRPGIVYGSSRGIIGDLFREAHAGVVRVVGRGENHWALVYDRDLGSLYARLAAESGASGVYHANDEGDERVQDVVRAIVGVSPGRPRVTHVSLADARAELGSYADALALDQIVRSPRARALGWRPSSRSIAASVARLHAEWKAGQRSA